MARKKIWTLIGADGKPYQSDVPGTLGGNRRGKLYGRFNCRAALSAIARGGYIQRRVFFLDEATAIAAGYRPCAVCLRGPYAIWKAAQASVRRSCSTES
ncbi:MAG TPA: metal-binding protein [Chloroflexota bacterium]|nr:metal-binding protein [Chloroflexota bacterium]HUX88782.1 metal-binding protein [Chloroflexota bacterium]